MGKYILVIEPSRIIRSILGVHLQLAGHTVMVFATYGLASGALPIFDPRPPDLVFVALHSSQPESCRLLKQARTHYPEATLVALVMPEESKHRAIQAALHEARAVALVKPFLIQDALALVAARWPGMGAPYETRAKERDESG